MDRAESRVVFELDLIGLYRIVPSLVPLDWMASNRAERHGIGSRRVAPHFVAREEV